jgi:hypothetical protein
VTPLGNAKEVAVMNCSNAETDELLARFRAAAATGVDAYECNLRTNEKDPNVWLDLFFEGRAALMFLAHHWKIHLRDSPDLEMHYDGEVLYAEVKHFRYKVQDAADELAMQAAGLDELVPYGELIQSEGKHAWEQIRDVTIKKTAQCIPDVPNILVIESSSVSLELMAGSATHAIDAACEAGFHELSRFSGIMLVEATGWTWSGEAEIEFCPTSHALAPLTKSLTRPLDLLCSRTARVL